MNKRHDQRHVSRNVRAVLVLATGTMGTAAMGQSIVPFGYSGGTYTQNFDTLPAASPTGTQATVNFPGTPVLSLQNPGLYAENVTPPAELTGWGFVRTAGTGANTSFIWSNGSSNSGAAYSLGTIGSSDRAFGALASNSQTLRIGLLLVNNSATTYTGFSINFVAEQWRSSTSTLNVLAFGYAVGGLDGTDALFSGTMAPQFTLDALGLGPVGTNGLTNGNDSQFQKAVSGLVSGGGFSWAPGQVLALTWQDVNDAGNDAAIGLDNFSFTATNVVAYTPKDLTWTGAANRNWDTGSANWTGGASTYTEDSSAGPIVADNVLFTSSGAGLVTIRPEGVQPNSLVVDSDADYTFEGGPIGGSTALIKRGSGTLTLNSPNTFTGGVQVRGGTLVLSNGNQLGSAGAPLVVTELSTVRFTAPVTAARGLSVPEGGATFDTQGHNVVFGPMSVGTINVNFPTVTKTGAGDLSVGSLFTAFGSVVRIAEGSLTIRANGNVTNSFGVDSDANYQGNLILDGHQQLDFAGTDGEPFQRRLAGGGQIVVKGPGRASETVAYSGANTTTLNARTGNIRLENAIVVNPDNSPNFRINFGASDAATGKRTLTIAAPVTGNTEVNFRDPSFTSNGTVVVEVPLAHTGRTTITMSQNGVVRLATANAFPTSTALVFGDGFFNPATIGALDLNGNTLTVGSLAGERRIAGTNAPQPTLIGGIVNTAGNAATLQITGSATTTYEGGIGDFSSENVRSPNPNINLRLTPAHTGHLTLTGSAGSVNYTGSTTVEGGRLTFATAYRSAGSAVAVSGDGELAVNVPTFPVGVAPVALEVGSVTLSGNGRLTVAPGSRAGGVNEQAVVVVSGLSITGSAFFDLTNNDLIVRNGNLAGLRSLVRQWLIADSGLPGTVGLGSSTAFYTAGGAFTTLAVYDNSAGLIGSFNGVDVSPSDVIVKYAYIGDTDLSGAVDAADLSRVLQGLNGGGSGWNFGDVDYDGVVDFTDLGRVLAALRGQGAPLGQSTLGQGGGVIPEPAALGLLALPVPLIARRRR